MRRQALDCERTGDADFAFILIGAVDEALDISIARDRGVDLLLQFAPRLPPSVVQPPGVGGPVLASLARYLPFLPSLVERLVQEIEQWAECHLPLLPNYIDLRIVCD
jgi:hypothetical protein